MKIGILGSGNMGRQLGLLWVEKGHEVFFGNRHTEKARAAAALAARPSQSGTLAEAARFADVLLHTARDAMPSEMVPDRSVLDGKILIDLNNSPMPANLEFGPVVESYAERYQADVPGLRVVKAFNTFAMFLISFQRPTGPLLQKCTSWPMAVGFALSTRFAPMVANSHGASPILSQAFAQRGTALKLC